MMNSHLDKALSLAERTGDRVIVVDRHDASVGYVVMGLAEYERFIDDSYHDNSYYDTQDDDDDDEEEWDSELFTPHGWHSADEDEDMPEIFSSINTNISEENGFFDEPPLPDEPDLDNAQGYGTINGTFSGISDDVSNEKRARNRWEIAREVKQSIEDVQTESDDTEDERFYLESL